MKAKKRSGATHPDENFMLVLREFEGAYKEHFGFEACGPATARLDDGQTITVNHAWFNLIGDMHVRFVIDGERTMESLTREQFAAYNLTPEEAVDIAIRNIRNRYGEPRAKPWTSAIMLVAGNSPDFDSSYFLDRSFWNAESLKHPEGMIAGVPKRGGLIYAPVSDARAVTSLEHSIRSLYETSENMRVSSLLYLYKDGGWSVHRTGSMH
jgi:hypothetical protein